MKKAAFAGGFFLVLLYKFRISSWDGFTAKFWVCRGYEYSADLEWVAGKTVLWLSRVGVDKISTLRGKSG